MSFLSEKPLDAWFAASVADDPDKRLDALKKIDDLTETENENFVGPAPILEALRRSLREERLAPFGLSAAEFVHRLLALSTGEIDYFHQYMEKIRQEEDQIIDEHRALCGDEHPGRLMKKLCLHARRQQPFDYAAMTWYTIFISGLGSEFLPAADVLRDMLQKENAARSNAIEIIVRMGSDGEIFFDDLVPLARLKHCSGPLTVALGRISRRCPEKIRFLLDQIDTQEPGSYIFLCALGEVGPDAERLVPGTEERLIALTHQARYACLGSADISKSDEEQGRLRWHCYYAILALASIGRSEKTLHTLLETLDLAQKSVVYRSDDRPTAEQVIEAAVFDALGRFASFPEQAVPRLIERLGVFEEFDPDVGTHSRILDALAAYASADPNQPAAWLTRPVYQTWEEEETPGLFRNRHAPCFQPLFAKLEPLLWEEPTQEEEEPSFDSDIAAFAGRFGSAAAELLPALERSKARLKTLYGDDYFDDPNDEQDDAQDEEQDDLTLALERIKTDRDAN